jgi:hypothetical protein
MGQLAASKTIRRTDPGAGIWPRHTSETQRSLQDLLSLIHPSYYNDHRPLRPELLGGSRI